MKAMKAKWTAATLMFNAWTSFSPQRMVRLLSGLVLLALVYAILSIQDARLVDERSRLESSLSIAVQTESKLQARASELDGSAHIAASGQDNGLSPGSDNRLMKEKTPAP